MSEQTIPACVAAQQEELDALESTYGEKIFTRTNEGHLLGAKLTFPTRLPNESLNIVYRKNRVEDENFKVRFLPPIFFDVTFPEGYPEIEPPNFVLHVNWLTPSELSSLCKKLDEIWKENEFMMIVFNWVDFLENDVLNYLGLHEVINLKTLFSFQSCLNSARRRKKLDNAEKGTRSSEYDARAKYIAMPVANIVPYLKDYNRTAEQKLFEESVVECSICFSKITGKECTMFDPCGHAFCNECTSQHIKTQMDGGLENGVVTCMEPGDCRSEILGSEVKRLIGDELFERYDELLLKRYLNSEKDITTCARESCGKPVIVDQVSTIATCAECNFSFCTECRRASHGINPCILNSKAERETITGYLNGDAAQREALEKKYSKQYLKALVANYQSTMWIAKNSKKCPHCGTDIQKSEGCNKMTCWKCRCKFCYLCGKDLDRLSNPYSHYNVTGTSCYMKLFEGLTNDDDDDEDNEDDDEDIDDDDFDIEFQGPFDLNDDEILFG